MMVKVRRWYLVTFIIRTPIVVDLCVLGNDQRTNTIKGTCLEVEIENTIGRTHVFNQESRNMRFR